MDSDRTLSRGDIHLLIAGVFLGTFVLVRITDPADYGMTLHPRLDKVWSMWRLIITSGWMLLAFAVATVRKSDALAQSFSYAAASSTAVGLLVLSTFIPESASWLAMFGSLAVYAGTSGVLCLKVQRPILAALFGALFFVLQVLTDGTVHFMKGVFQIH